MHAKPFHFGLILLAVASAHLLAPGKVRAADVPPANVKADGVTDDTAALQAALDEAGKAGGPVNLPAARYLVRGSLRIPPGVTLQGVSEAPVWSEPLRGTIVLAMGGRGQEDGPATFELGHSAAVRGLTVFHPDQVVTNIQPWAWTFHLQGHDNTVENVTLINSYNGIRIGPDHAIITENNGVRGVEIRNGIGARAIVANNEPVAD